MKCFSALLVVIACCWAQAQVGKNSANFVSPDGSLEFNYPESFVFCKRSPQQPDSWADDACLAYTPICSDYQCTSTGTIACVALPHDSTVQGTNLEGAAFSVNVNPNVHTESACLEMAEPPPQVGRPQQVIVNGTKFQMVQTDGVGAGNFIDGYAYRGFHNNKCYELDIRIAYSNAANYDVGTIREFDFDKVHARLDTILKSFKFLK